MNRMLAITFIALLTSCSNQPHKVSYDCPQIVLPSKPDLPIRYLSEKSLPPDVIKAYVASVVSLNRYIDAVQNQVSST